MIVESQIYNTSLLNSVMFHYLEQVWLTAFKVKCLEKVSIKINENFTILFSSRFKEFVAIFSYKRNAIVKIAAIFTHYTYMHVRFQFHACRCMYVLHARKKPILTITGQ